MSFCQHCGHESTVDEKFCGHCGKSLDKGVDQVTPIPAAQESAGAAPSNERPPDNHLAKAIVTTIVCCLPAGVVAIVYASSVNSKFIAGDVAGAYEAANKANTWGNWSIGLALVVYVLYGIVMLISAAVSAA